MAIILQASISCIRNKESKLNSRLNIQLEECLVPFSSEFLSFRLLSTNAKVQPACFAVADWERVADVSEAVDKTHPTVFLTLRQCRCEIRSHTKEKTQSEGTRQHVSEDMRHEEGEVKGNRRSWHNEAFDDLYSFVRTAKSKMVKWKEHVAWKVLRMKKHIKFMSKNTKGRHGQLDLQIDWRIILKSIWRKEWECVDLIGYQITVFRDLRMWRVG